jgi:MFS family permease
MNNVTNAPRGEVESAYACVRLAAALAIMTIAGSGMYSMAVAIPTVQAEFGSTRGGASFAYTLTMLGFSIGGILMGRLADRFGVIVPTLIGAVGLGIGFFAAGMSQSLLQFTLAHGLLIGFLGCSPTFAPLVADTSLWFTKHRGIAVAICASGNYCAGALWPPVLQYFFDTVGWRQTYIGTGIFCAVSMVLLSTLMYRRPPALDAVPTAADVRREALPLGVRPNTLMAMIVVAGISCCVAMSMPQVHIVAYCSDLGYGAARGAEMLALMLGAGIVSRIVSGIISDRIGGIRTLLLGSVLQGVALVFFLPFDGLASLYAVSIFFGLVQGGLVPAYAVIVREYFNPRETGVRVGLALFSTIFGMALGGWMSGAIFDLTGSYRAAFINGIAFNLLNLSVALWLLSRARGGLLLRPGLR